MRNLEGGSLVLAMLHLTGCGSQLVGWPVDDSGVPPDTTAPFVTATSPIDGATQIAGNTNLIATFSEAIDTDTLTEGSFLLDGGTTGTVTAFGLAAVRFTPDADLEPATEYVATLTSDITDLAGVHMEADYTWAFTTAGDAPDDVRPWVIETAPTDGETGIVIDAWVEAVFSEAMDPSTISAATIELIDPEANVVASAVYYDVPTKTGTLIPDRDLLPGSTYTGIVSTGVADLAGNTMADQYTWSFTTQAADLDILRPFVLSTDPMDLAIDVPVETAVEVLFSEAMDPTTISELTIELMDPDAAPVSGSVYYDVPTQTGTFVPDRELLAGAIYSGTVTTGVADVAGNTMALPYTWIFVTQAADLDILRPFVLATVPTDLAFDVAADSVVDVIFSEAMDPTTITELSIELMDADAVLVPGAVYYDVPTETGTFVPDDDLVLGMTYTGTVTTGVADVAGNTMAAPYTWTFTTEAPAIDPIPPVVLVTDPTDLEIDVEVDTALEIWFSEEMDPLTIDETTIELYDPDYNVLTGTVSYDIPARYATFVPDAELLPGRTYTATVTTGATDEYGNPLVEDYVWTFTTTLDVWVLDPVPLGTLETFVAVAGAGLTNSNSAGTTTLGGDVGLSGGVCLGDGAPCTATNPVILGTLYQSDTTAAQAQTDLTAAYVDAMSRPPGTTVADISGMTLPAGVYTSEATLTIAVGATVTLDGGGDDNAVWIFQIGSSLTANNSSQIILVNGAHAENVYWAAAASTTLGSNVSFQGNVFSGASNSVGTGASVVGRLLCTTGAITLLSNNITLP